MAPHLHVYGQHYGLFKKKIQKGHEVGNMRNEEWFWEELGEEVGGGTDTYI